MNRVWLGESKLKLKEYSLDEIQGFEAPSLTFSRDTDTRTVNVSDSGDLLFTGKAYDFLVEQLFTPPCRNQLCIRLYIECCDRYIDYLITPGGMVHCPDECTISGVASGVYDTDTCMARLNKIWWTNNGVDQGEFKDNITTQANIPYCGGGSFWLFLLGAILGPILSVGALLGVGEKVLERLAGCGKSHGIYKIREIIEFNLKRCGLSFKSNILNAGGKYDCLSIVCAQNVEGQSDCPLWIDLNAPIVSFVELMNDLKKVFNADYRIVDGQFCFDTEEDLNARYKDVLTDVDKSYRDGLADEPPCYAMEEDDRCAYGRFEYSSDSLDSSANTVKNIYNDLVEWNDPPQKGRNKECACILENFSPAAFAGDVYHISDKDQALFSGNPQVYRPFGALILTEGVSEKCKLLNVASYRNGPGNCNYAIVENKIADNQTGTLDVLETGDQYNPFPLHQRHIFNCSLLFAEQAPWPELYKCYHATEDPRNADKKKWIINQFSEDIRCEVFDSVLENGMDTAIQTANGLGFAEEIEFNFKTNQVIYKNIRICQEL